MKANELRIDNWLKRTSTGKYFRADGYTILKMVFMGSVDEEGIPLTSEILGKCGFEEGFDGLRIRLSLNSHLRISNFYQMAIIETAGNSFINSLDHIKHLHELQNLYFSLTGTDLNITL